MLYSAVQCYALQCIVVHCKSMNFRMTVFRISRDRANVSSSSLQHSTVALPYMHSTVLQYSTVQYCSTVLYNIAEHYGSTSIAQFNTAELQKHGTARSAVPKKI